MPFFSSSCLYLRNKRCIHFCYVPEAALSAGTDFITVRCHEEVKIYNLHLNNGFLTCLSVSNFSLQNKALENALPENKILLPSTLLHTDVKCTLLTPSLCRKDEKLNFLYINRYHKATFLLKVTEKVPEKSSVGERTIATYKIFPPYINLFSVQSRSSG